MFMSNKLRKKVKQKINNLPCFQGMDIITEEYHLVDVRFSVFVVLYYPVRTVLFLIYTTCSFIVYSDDFEKTIFYFVTLGLFFKGIGTNFRQKLYKILEVYDEFYKRHVPGT